MAIGVDVLTAVIMKNDILWGQYSLTEIYQCFRGTYCFHLQVRRVSQPRRWYS